MKKGKMFRLILTVIFTLILSTITFATGVDILPPTGEMTIENASLKDDVYYTTASNVTLNISATDKVTPTENLKMIVSNKPLTGDELANDSLWETFDSRYSWTIEGEVGELNKIYLYLKDEAGNISPNTVTSTKQFTVTYAGEGATNLPSTQAATYGLPFNIAIKEPKKVNKYFRGWSLDPQATVESWLSDDVIEAKYITNDITLYAVWSDEPRNFSEVAKVGDWVSYPVEYENVNTNSSSYKSNMQGWRVLDISNGAVKLISAGTPLSYNKTGSNQDAINTLTTNFLNTSSQNYSEYGFENDISTVFSNEYTKSVESITSNHITKLTNKTRLNGLDISNCGGVLNNGSYYYIATEADTTNLYYVEANNQKISSTTGVTYGIRPVVTLSYKTQITGRNNIGNWQLTIPSIEITLNNGGSITKKIVVIGEKYGELPTPTKTGYTFLGWYNENNEQITSETIVKETSTTLTAKWVANTYEVTFNANGGTITSTGGTTTTRIVTYGSTYGGNGAGFPSVTREDYNFLGWFTEVDGGTQITADTIVDETASDLTLYAHWEARLMDLIPSKANAPVLGEGMKAVYWTGEDGTGETTEASYPAGTYNYTIGDGKTDSKDSKWANAITESDGSYWVWIPRYAYKITYTNEDKTEYSGNTTSTATINGEKTQYGNIDILFMYGTSDTQYRDENGNAVDLPEDYKVHPAFQAMTTTEDLATNPLGKWDEELEGIWVAKYEASMEKLSSGTWTNIDTTSSNSVGNVTTSSTVRMVSKPSVISWIYINESKIYTNSLNMHTALNSHEMKNSEWGAVAYLMQSAYGRNGNEIGVNQCSSYYTGAGPGKGSSTIKNIIYEYNSSNFSSTYAWNTTQGKLASTTGNIYGIYDMSGGAEEYVAAYVNNGHSYITKTSYGGTLRNINRLKDKTSICINSNRWK